MPDLGGKIDETLKKYDITELKDTLIYYILNFIEHNDIKSIREFNLQEIIKSISYVRNIIPFENTEEDLNMVFNLICNKDFQKILQLIKKIDDNRLVFATANMFRVLHNYGVNLKNINLNADVKKLLQYIDNHLIAFNEDIIINFKLIIENFDELIEKEIPQQNWVAYCNLKMLSIVKEQIPEAMDIILSSGNKDIKVNLSEEQINYYLNIITENKITPDAEQQVSHADMQQSKIISHAATQHETIKDLQLQLPFYKNITQDDEGNYLLYEMLPGFDPKSLLVNHSLDCCLVANGVATNILPYMAKNTQNCGMFTISKINNIEIIENLKFKIKELNNICNTLPFDIKKFTILNEEIKNILVNRDNLKSNITILGASFTYLKDGNLVFDNIETNNKSFIKDETGNSIRYNMTTLPFMECYANYSKIAMEYNNKIKISTIGLGCSDIAFKEINEELSNKLGFNSLKNLVSSPVLIGDGIYTDAKRQLILGTYEDFQNKIKIKSNKKLQ